MSFGKTAPRLCALFTAAAMAAAPVLAAPAFAAPAGLQPRVATPQQMQQFDEMEAELAARENAYTVLRQKFDLGQMSAEQYRAAVAALDAKQAKPQATAALPDILRPRIAGCTKDGYSVNIPVNLTIGTGEFSKQPHGAMATQMLARLDQALQAVLRNANVRLIATTNRDDVVKPAFKTAIDAVLAKFSTDMTAQMHLDVKAAAQDIETASTSNCLIQPGATSPSP
jgi:hypothetical protein